MDMLPIPGKMVPNLRESGNMEKSLVMVNLQDTMVRCMKGNGRIIRQMDKGNIFD